MNIKCTPASFAKGLFLLSKKLVNGLLKLLLPYFYVALVIFGVFLFVTSLNRFNEIVAQGSSVTNLWYDIPSQVIGWLVYASAYAGLISWIYIVVAMAKKYIVGVIPREHIDLILLQFAVGNLFLGLCFNQLSLVFIPSPGVDLLALLIFKYTAEYMTSAYGLGLSVALGVFAAWTLNGLKFLISHLLRSICEAGKAASE